MKSYQVHETSELPRCLPQFPMLYKLPRGCGPRQAASILLPPEGATQSHLEQNHEIAADAPGLHSVVRDNQSFARWLLPRDAGEACIRIPVYRPPRGGTR